MGEEEYEVLIDALGVRCKIQEEVIELRRAERAKRGASISLLWSQLRLLTVFSGCTGCSQV